MALLSELEMNRLRLNTEHKRINALGTLATKNASKPLPSEDTPYQPKPETPNYQVSPQTMQQAGPGASQFIQSGNRVMTVEPGGTMTNFPTARNVGLPTPEQTQQRQESFVDQAVMRARELQQAQAPQPTVQPGAMPVSPQDQRKEQMANQALSGKEATHVAEWIKQGPNSERLLIRPKTQEEQLNEWDDFQVARAAGIPTIDPKTGQASIVNILSDKVFPDAVMYSPTISKSDPRWKSWMREGNKEVKRLWTAVATRSEEFKTIEDVRKFVDNLNFSPMVGTRIENEMTKILKEKFPDLYKQIVGQRKVDKLNQTALRNTFKEMRPDATDLSDDAIDQQLQDPDTQAEMQGLTPMQSVDPVTGQPVLAPQEEEKQASLKLVKETRREEENIKRIVRENPDLVLDYRSGKPEAVTRREMQRREQKEAIDQQQIELKQQSDQRAEAAAALKAKQDELKLSPAHREWVKKEATKEKFKEARLVKLEDQYQRDLTKEEEGNISAGQAMTRYDAALDRLENDPRYLPSPEPGATMEALPAPDKDQQSPQLQEKARQITEGLQRPDLTVQERAYLQQKLQQIQGGAPPAVATPAPEPAKKPLMNLIPIPPKKSKKEAKR